MRVSYLDYRGLGLGEEFLKMMCALLGLPMIRGKGL